MRERRDEGALPKDLPSGPKRPGHVRHRPRPSDPRLSVPVSTPAESTLYRAPGQSRNQRRCARHRFVQPALRQALSDEDLMVAGDAARALGALGERASPSVRALVKTLSHKDPYVRIYAAEALASIGPKAGAATKDLARALGDPIPGVRWAAGEALASIGPAAQSAVPQLIEALKDEFLYVRICAAGALGSLGPKAQTAREALRAAANDPALRDEAEWALNRIAGIESGEPVVSSLCPRLPSRPNPRRQWLKRAILRLTGIRPPGGTSSGASSWETRRSAVPWWPAMRSMWVPTTPGK